MSKTMTNDERLAAMRNAVMPMLREAGLLRIDPESGESRAWIDAHAGDRLVVTCTDVHGNDLWNITVVTPETFADGYRRRSNLSVDAPDGNAITPLALRLLNALDALMWENRLTEDTSDWGMS